MKPTIKARTLLALATGSLFLTGCGFQGVQNMRLPGGVGNGSDAVKLTVELPDVGTLTPNGEVKVGDVAVGTINKIEVEDWHAVAKISVDPKTRLPENAVARVGVNSLLGASYLELAAPTDEPARGVLRTGDTIPLAHGEAYPATEQVLSAASVVLNGGGLEQLGTITTELNKAFSGNDLAVRDLLPRLNSFVSALDAQKTQIFSAIDSLDRLSVRFARQRGTLTKAVDEIGPALRTLSKERPKLTAALTSLRRLGNVATPLVNATRADIVGNLRDLAPTLRSIDAAGDSLVRGLGFAVTFPFAPETVTNACRGDYCNLDLILDLTNGALINGFTTPNGTPTLPGMPGLPSIPDLLDLLGLGGLGNVTGPITGGLQQLLGVPQSPPASSEAPSPGGSGTSSTSGSNVLGDLLGGLLGGGRRTERSGS